MEQEEYAKHVFFICYRRISAEDLARHLRGSLEELEIPAFLDIIDIPKKSKKTEWRKYRDEALRNSRIVLLLITPGFEKSDEVRSEMSLAFDEEKELMLLRHKDLDPNIIIELKDKQINLGDYNQISFDTKEELVREVHSAWAEKKVKLCNIPSIEKRETQIGKFETVPPIRRETREIVLLPEGAQITKLRIDNDLLNQIYEQAHRQAIDRYDDARLSYFCIQVFPFREVGSKVTIYLYFYSKWADKKCTFRFSDESPQVNHAPPDRPAKDYDRDVFTRLPWNESPQ